MFASFGPCLGSHLGELAGMHGRQAREHVAHVGKGIDVALPADLGEPLHPALPLRVKI